MQKQSRDEIELQISLLTQEVIFLGPMKAQSNRFFWLTILLLVVGSSVHCSKEKSEPVLLSLRLQKGEEYKEISTTESKIQMGAKEKIEITLKMISGITQKIENTDANGDMTVKATYDWVDLYGKALGTEKHFDTRVPQPNTPEALAQLPGKSFQAVFNARGEILSISDPSQIFELMEKAGEELFLTEVSQEDKNLPSLSEETKKQLLQAFTYIPTRPVKVGEHWQTNFRSRRFLYFDGTVDFVLSQSKDGIAQMDFTFKAVPVPPEPDSSTSGGEKLKVMASGEGKGRIKVSEKTGALLLYERSETYFGEGIGTVPGKTEPVKFPVQVQNTLRIEDHSK